MASVRNRAFEEAERQSKKKGARDFIAQHHRAGGQQRSKEARLECNCGRARAHSARHPRPAVHVEARTRDQLPITLAKQ